MGSIVKYSFVPEQERSSQPAEKGRKSLQRKPRELPAKHWNILFIWIFAFTLNLAGCCSCNRWCRRGNTNFSGFFSRRNSLKLTHCSGSMVPGSARCWGTSSLSLKHIKVPSSPLGLSPRCFGDIGMVARPHLRCLGPGLLGRGCSGECLGIAGHTPAPSTHLSP